MEVRPGYKQTEVGVIPEDWNILPLGDIGKFKNGINKNGEAFGHGSPFVNLMDVFGVSQITSNDLLDLVDTNNVEQQTYNLQKGDVIFVRSSVKPSGVGLTAVVERDLCKTVYSGFLIRLRDGGNLSCGFKRHCFYEEGFRRRVIGASSVSANTNITQDSLKRLLLAFPPTKAEQEAIAQALNDADAHIEALEQLIAKKHNLKQGAMQELLSGKKRLPGFSAKWELMTFDGVLLRVNAKGHQILASDYQVTGQCPVVDQGKEHVVGFSDRHEKRFQCPEGGVIVFGDHTCIVKFVDFDFLVGAEGTQILEARSGQCARYHAFQLQHRGIPPTGYNRHFKHLKERDFVVPPLAEQTAITVILSDMDAEIASLDSELAKARNIKQGMMQELLTGKTRLI